MVGRWSYQVRWERVGWSGAKVKVEERCEPSLQRPETEKERHSIRMNAFSSRYAEGFLLTSIQIYPTPSINMKTTSYCCYPFEVPWSSWSFAVETSRKLLLSLSWEVSCLCSQLLIAAAVDRSISTSSSLNRKLPTKMFCQQ